MMKWISFTILFGVLIAWNTHAASSTPPSPRSAHPLAWMHGLPVGEQPGWTGTWWTNFEISNSNVWNAPLTMTDKRNGRTYEYMADFEQAHAVLEVGHAFTDWLGVSAEAPFDYRSGGGLDDFIDDFHVLIGNRRFNRQYYPKNQNIFSVKTDGEEFYQQGANKGGLNQLRLKMKFWFFKWADQDETSPAGIAISSQTKFPTRDETAADSTGHIDQSFLLHLGVPLFTQSLMWVTAGYTILGKNPAFEKWPRHKTNTFYEGHLDLDLAEGWGLTLNVRAESPLLDRRYLEYSDSATDPNIIIRNRAASGWNSLVHWRGTQTFGFRYRPSNTSLVQFLMSEDWGLGPYDAADDIYTTNAPDVSFTLQTQFTW